VWLKYTFLLSYAVFGTDLNSGVTSVRTRCSVGLDLQILNTLTVTMKDVVQGMEPANNGGTGKENVRTSGETGRRIRRIFCRSVLTAGNITVFHKTLKLSLVTALNCGLTVLVIAAKGTSRIACFDN